MISYKKLHDEVKSLWNCDFWPTENSYLPVDIDWFEQTQAGCQYPYVIDRLFECEELADLFVLQFKMQHINELFSFERNSENPFDERGERVFVGERENLYNYAIGVAAGTQFDGRKRNHTVNIFYADGLYLYDFQTRRIWKASKNDKILKVRF